MLQLLGAFEIERLPSGDVRFGLQFQHALADFAALDGQQGGIDEYAATFHALQYRL